MNIKEKDEAALAFLRKINLKEKEVPVTYGDKEKIKSFLSNGFITLPLLSVKRDKAVFETDASGLEYMTLVYDLSLYSLYEGDATAIIDELVERHRDNEAFKLDYLEMVEGGKVSLDEADINLLEYQGKMRTKVRL